MSRQFNQGGNPLFGGPLPPKGGSPIVPQKNILWQKTPVVIAIPTGTVGVRFSPTKQFVSSITIFADTSNTVSVQVGDPGVRVSAINLFDNINFQLDPGRSATIYTDDFERELFDLSRWAGVHSDPAATQFLYLTIWNPNYI